MDNKREQHVCENCGGPLNYDTCKNGQPILKCVYCGKEYEPEYDFLQKGNLQEKLLAANICIYGNEFDKAQEIYRQIIEDYPNLAVGYLGDIRCHLGIKLIREQVVLKKYISEELTEHQIYKNALYALRNNNKERELFLKSIKIYTDLLSKTKKIIENKKIDYDIFICFKQRVGEGDDAPFTKDYFAAKAIYEKLKNKFKVFFAPTADITKGEDFEPYIFAALEKSVVLFAVSSYDGNLNATWPKSEWERFLDIPKFFPQKGNIKVFPVAVDGNMYGCIPEELCGREGFEVKTKKIINDKGEEEYVLQDCSQIDLIIDELQEFIAHKKRKFGNKLDKIISEHRTGRSDSIQQPGWVDAESRKDYLDICADNLSKGRFREVLENAEQILSNNDEDAEALKYCLLAKSKSKDFNEFFVKIKNKESFCKFEKAIGDIIAVAADEERIVFVNELQESLLSNITIIKQDSDFEYIADKIIVTASEEESKARCQIIADKLKQEGRFDLSSKYYGYLLDYLGETTDSESNEARAGIYWNLLQCDLGCKDEKELSTLTVKIYTNQYYKYAYYYATGQFKEQIRSVNRSNLHDIGERKEKAKRENKNRQIHRVLWFGWTIAFLMLAACATAAILAMNNIQPFSAYLRTGAAEIGKTKAAMAVWITVFIAVLIGGFSIYVLTTLLNKDVYDKYNDKNTEKHKGKRFCHLVLVLCCLLSFSVVGFNYIAVYNADKDLESQYDFIYLSTNDGYAISSFYGNTMGELYGKNNQAEVIIPDYYKGKKVVAIEDNAFSDCDSITSLKMGENIKTIGAYAFKNCSGLEEISLNNSVQQIGEGAFYGCSSLTDITLPFVGKSANVSETGIDTLFGYIFGASKSDLDSHSLGDGSKQITVFDNKDFSIPESLKRITILGGKVVDGAFADCDAIESIVLGQGVKNIGKYAFYDCDALKKVEIGKSVTEIDYAAFHKCSTLTSVIFSENSSLKTIRDSAFNSCTALDKIHIPNSVETIEKDVFWDCGSLSEISVPFVGGIDSNGEKVEYFGFIFWGYDSSDFAKMNSYIPTSLKTVIVSGGETIRREAFYRCQNIECISIPDTVKSIGVGAFNGCASLKELTIPFVGERGDYTEASQNTLFGYIFGSDATSENLGCFKTHQVYAQNTYADYYYIPSSLKTVNVTGADGVNLLYGAFSFVKDIETVNFGNGVTKIPMNCFWQNRDVGYTGDLKTVVMTDNVIEIGETAFFNCKDLITIKLSDNLQVIGTGIFGGCDSVETVSLNNVEYISSHSETYFMAYKFEKDNSVSEVNIEDNCVFIYHYAFAECSSLTTVNIPESVKYIGRGAFSNCASLSSLPLPDELNYLASDALKGCVSLPITEEDNALYYMNKGKESFIGVTSQDITSLRLKASVDISALDFKEYANLQTLTIESEIDPYTISKKVNSGVSVVSGGKTYKIYKDEFPRYANNAYQIIDVSGNKNANVASDLYGETWIIGNKNYTYTGSYFCFCAIANNDVRTVHLKDFNFTSTSNLGSLCNYSNEQFATCMGGKVVIDVHGDCKLYNTTGLVEVIKLPNQDITFTGDGSLIIKAGNGANGSSAGANGSNGAAGIYANSIAVDMTGSLTVYGGNGGNGATGASGTPGSGVIMGNGTPGGSGYAGGNGGNGARAVLLQSKLIVENGEVVLIGGSGGVGGMGGAGGSGANHAGLYWGTVGGSGGQGGQGGNGNKAISSNTYISIASGGTYLAINGNGGQGGKGGQAGIGGTSGNSTGWAPGTGGTGGRGGDGNRPGVGGQGGDGNWDGNYKYVGSSGSNGSSGSVIFDSGDRTFAEGSGIIIYGYNTLSNNEFLNGTREYAVYDNTNKGVKIENITRSADNKLGLSYEMKITSKLGSDNRHMGGYYRTLPVSSRNEVFYYTIYAKIPVGYSIGMYSNSMGDDVKEYWLTDNKGTGKWQWYIGVTECGVAGAFSVFGYVAIKANDECVNPLADNIVWYVGFSQGARYQPYNGNNTEVSSELEYNGHTYRLVKESLTWEQAKVRAEELGGHLVSITSEEENHIVKQLVVNSGLTAVWLGATDKKVEGKWQWVTNEEFEYSYWGKINTDSWEPNGGNNCNCLVFYLGNYANGIFRWDDTYNDNPMSGFIVEFE